MPARSWYDYAVIRVTPRVERGEFINAGVVLHCAERGYLGARTELDAPRLAALAPDLDPDPIRRSLEAVELVCAGRGPIGALTPAKRFDWLVSPRSTVVQMSPVHCGLCTDPADALERLIQVLVRRPSGPPGAPGPG
jgi:hypothetical protein